jgi:hypothetical protein
MPALADLQTKQAELIRKWTTASMCVAPITAALPTTLTSGGTHQVQTITVTGTPTGGTFTLTFAGQPTAPIAYNATANAVITALEALLNINPGDVTGGGGPLPGTPVTVTFRGQFINPAVMTASSASLTGGTSPTVTPSITTPGTAIDLLALPAGYSDLGYVTKDDGYSFGNEWETSEVTSHGVADATRRDVLTTTTTIGLTAQETKRNVQEMFYGIDLSGVTPTATTGEVAFNKPLQPASRYYRTFLLGADGDGDQIIYMAMIYPRAMVSETGEQTGSEESEFGYPLTLTATPDSTVGYSVRYLFGGPGWRALLNRMGW